MFPIFVVLPFETPGGIGAGPKITRTFQRMKERTARSTLRKGTKNSLSEQELVTTSVPVL